MKNNENVSVDWANITKDDISIIHVIQYLIFTTFLRKYLKLFQRCQFKTDSSENLCLYVGDKEVMSSIDIEKASNDVIIYNDFSTER